MKISRQEKAQHAIELLLEMNYKIPSGLRFVAILPGITNLIENNFPYEHIIREYSLGITPESFTSVWKTATGTNITEVVRKDAKYTKLVKAGFDETQIKDIMKALK